MILRRIRRIKRFLRELFYFKKLIKKYGDILQPGRYYLFPSLRAIAANDPEVMESARQYFAKNKGPGKLTGLISKINKTNYYRNAKSGALETYEAIYSANNYDKVREIKLFSFRRKEILTVCTNEAACEQQLTEYDCWHKWFAMPPVTRQNRYGHAYSIAMVSLLPRVAEVTALENIAQSVGAYCNDNPEHVKKVSVRQLINFAFDEEMNSQLSALVAEISTEVLSAELPLCLQHGDLSRDNLIYGICNGETGFWWIDWEHAGERLFLYDYFFYILNTAVYFSDFEGLHAYLSGECDEHLKKLFSQLGVTYDPASRKDYFLIFAVAFLKERVCDLGNERALKMYLDFLKNQL